MKLHALGLCGVDDSIHPNQLVMYAQWYPLLEFGVLFRPDKEGQPRYPSKEWVNRLVEAVKAKNNSTSSSSNTSMKLAAHLCGERVDEVLRGDDSFVRTLQEWGFGRVQINATAINGVDVSVFSNDDENPNNWEGRVIANFLSVVHKHPSLEFILQKNDETRPLWEGVLEHCYYYCANNENDAAERERVLLFPSNVSMLLDESKGTGVLPETWPPIPANTPYKIGYAGGIGPSNVSDILSKLNTINDRCCSKGDDDDNDDETTIWIDMESSLRSQKNGRDVFDLDKCYQVVLKVCQTGFLSHPPFLESKHRK